MLNFSTKKQNKFNIFRNASSKFLNLSHVSQLINATFHLLYFDCVWLHQHEVTQSCEMMHSLK